MLSSLIKPNPNSRKSPLRVSKKTEKPRKSEKNNRKNWSLKINRLKFWKNRPVRFGFGFISLKPKKPNQTEPKLKKIRKKPSQNRKKTEPNRKKLSQNKKKRAKPVWIGFCPKKPNRTETGRYELVSVRF